MNMKIIFTKKKTWLVSALCMSMMIVGALSWSTVTLVADNQASRDASGIPVLVFLSSERALADFDTSGSPDAAVRAAAGIEQVIWAVTGSGRNLYSKSESVQSFIKEAKLIDFNVLMGYPDNKCSRGAAVQCWIYPAAQEGIYPSQEVADRVRAEFKHRDLGKKLHVALADMQIANLKSQRFGSTYENNHPVLAWVDNLAYQIAYALKRV